MEPLTHFLTGACIGRAGFNRKTAYATVAATVAAEAADLDILWGFAGPVEGLKHHRGITHTFLAIPVVAALTVGAVWLYHIVRERRRHNAEATSPDSTSAYRRPQQVRWDWLYLTTFIAASSHILLDWTNNYGVRPFFPFSPRWYAGSFVFIAEPVLWGLFALAFIVPWLFGLTDSEIGIRRKRFRGGGWAIFALAGMVVFWCWRWAEHAQAQALLENMQIASAPISRIAVEPYPVNPFRWHAIVETPGFYQFAEINTQTQSVDSDPARDLLYKPADTPAVEAAKRTFLGRVYLDWGRWAVVRDLGQETVDGTDPPQLPPGRTWTTVRFWDLRFAYPSRGSGGGRDAGASVLSGWVYIVDGHDEAAEGMGGREQK